MASCVVPRRQPSKRETDVEACGGVEGARLWGKCDEAVMDVGYAAARAAACRRPGGHPQPRRQKYLRSNWRLLRCTGPMGGEGVE